MAAAISVAVIHANWVADFLDGVDYEWLLTGNELRSP